MRNFDKLDKETIDAWRKAAATVPDSTRLDVMAMKKSGKSVREVSLALELPSVQVSIIVIEELAKERGETPVFPGDGPERRSAEAEAGSA